MVGFLLSPVRAAKCLAPGRAGQCLLAAQLCWASAMVAGADPESAQQLIEVAITAQIDPDEIGMDQLDGLDEDDEADLPGWVDEKHAEATNRARALAQWTDSFFGAPVQDAERSGTFIA